MLEIAFVTDADCGAGLALFKSLLRQGYQVFAGQYAEEVLPLQELKGEFGEGL